MNRIAGGRYEEDHAVTAPGPSASGGRVAQGERIGLVGATGLATGPHLDFRIRQHGQFRNFEALRLPPALPVAKSDWNEFIEIRDRWIAELPPLPGKEGPTRAHKAAAPVSAASSQ